MTAQPEPVTPVLQAVQRLVTRHLLDAAEIAIDDRHGGAVSLIQRFGRAANLNVRPRCLVLSRRGYSGDRRSSRRLPLASTRSGMVRR